MANAAHEECKYHFQYDGSLSPNSSGANKLRLSFDLLDLRRGKRIPASHPAYSQLTLHFTGSANTNNAVHISLVAPSDAGIKTIHSFNPKMTYSIFGDEETVFGYQGLKINLRYNACDMRPGVQIMYTKKFKTIGDTSPTDLKTILEPYLPKSKYGPIMCSAHLLMVSSCF